MAIQGLGQVGFALAGMLAGEGGRLIVADLDADRVARAIDAFGGLPASTDEVHRIDAVPKTLNGKKMEVPVKRILQGTPVDEAVSCDAMANPDAMTAIKALRGP